MVRAAAGTTAAAWPGRRGRCLKRVAFLVLLLAALASPAVHATPPLPQAGQPVPTYSLDDCLQFALDRNPDILKAQHDIERTQGLVITAKSTLYPHVGVSGRIEERDDDLFDQGQDPTIQHFRDFYTVQLQVVQSIYSGGVNRQQIAIAKLQHEAALIQLQATIDEILRQVKVAVYAIVIDEAELDAQNLTIKLLQDEGSRQQDLFNAGRTTRFNVLRTQVSLGNEQAQLSDVETDLVARRIALGRLLNIDWPLRQSRLDAYVADQEFRDQTLSSFNQVQNGYALGLLGTWDVFDGFAGRGQKMVDTASLASQRISRDELQLQIENEVREAYARLLTAQATIQAQAANQKTAEESVKLARISAESGYATLLDVLQATLDLTAARTNLIRSRQLYLDALADLEHAVSLKFVDWPGSSNALRNAAATTPTTQSLPALAPTPSPAPATLHP
jgi:outer membrane protein